MTLTNDYDWDIFITQVNNDLLNYIPFKTLLQIFI